MTNPVVGCIKQSIEEIGIPPSIRELADCLGVSVATAHERLLQAEAEGFIQRMGPAGRKTSRAIRILTDGN